MNYKPYKFKAASINNLDKKIRNRNYYSTFIHVDGDKKLLYTKGGMRVNSVKQYRDGGKDFVELEVGRNNQKVKFSKLKAKRYSEFKTEDGTVIHEYISPFVVKDPNDDYHVNLSNEFHEWLDYNEINIQK